MSNAGWASARSAGLACIIDLRNDAERGRRPEHPVIDARSAEGFRVLHTPTEDPDDPAFLQECGPWLDHPRSWAPNIRRFPAKIAQVFRSIADADRPTLIHCAGGRDRTGMVCSMLLALNGVRPDAIAANYEHGFRGAGAHRGHGLGYDATTGEWVETSPAAPWTIRELDDALTDRIPVLLEWVEQTDVEECLLDAGVEPAAVVRLRQLLRS